MQDVVDHPWTFSVDIPEMGHLYRNGRGTVGGSTGGAECRGGARTTGARTTGITESHQASRKDTRALQEARQAVKEAQGVNQGVNKLGQQQQMRANAAGHSTSILVRMPSGTAADVQEELCV